MKKKFVLVLALVLLVASTAFAGDVKFSGRVRQGYKFTFQDGSDPAITSQRAKEGKIAIKVEDADGLWALSFGDIGTLNSDDKLAANASVSLSKALAAAGVDLKDWSISFGIGNTGADTGLRAYNDPNGNGYDKFKNNGTYSVDATVGYGSLVSVKLAVDPTSDRTTAETWVIDQDPKSQTYGTLKKIDATTVKSRSFVGTVLVTPMDGLKIAAGYAYNEKGGWGETWNKSALYAATSIDVAKLIGNKDFKLTVGAWDHFLIGYTENNVETKSKNFFEANIAGGVEKVDGWIEFDMFDEVMNLNVHANFNLVKNLGLDAYFNFKDMSAKKATSYNIGADVSYLLGGVSYSLNAEYAWVKDAKGAFSLTPAVAISF